MPLPTYYRLPDTEADIGWLVDGDVVYLATPLEQDNEPDPLGLFFRIEAVDELAGLREGMRAPEPFLAVEYSNEVDRQLRKLIDVLISLRFAHPTLTQLEFELDLEALKLIAAPDRG